jgi:hypothetical protein
MIPVNVFTPMGRLSVSSRLASTCTKVLRQSGRAGQQGYKKNHHRSHAHPFALVFTSFQHSGGAVFLCDIVRQTPD